MKNILLFILLFISVVSVAQERNICIKDNYIRMLTNDSTKYWDLICRSDKYLDFDCHLDTNQNIQTGICFNKNYCYSMYDCFRNLNSQRLYDNYVLDTVFQYKISNDTIYLSYTKAIHKIEYISNDILILGVFKCYKNKYEYEMYKTSNNQKSKPISVDYWNEIYNDSILNKLNNEIKK